MALEVDKELKEESKKLARLSYGAIAGVLLSRTSGLLRTFIVNATYGVGLTMDAFNLAFRFPNSLRDLFADGALSAAFIKTLVDARAKGPQEERQLIAVVMGFFLIVTVLIALLWAFFSRSFIGMISDERFFKSGGVELASSLFKILAFYLPLTMLNSVAMGILGVLGQTFKAMNGSLFLSVGMIAGSLCLGPLCPLIHLDPIYGLTIGSLMGVFMQMLYQFYPLFKMKMIPKPCFNLSIWLHYKPLHEALWLMLPRALGQGALTLALLINTSFAIEVGQGVLTYIVTAVTIIQVPIGLFGVATGFAAQPVLAKAIQDKHHDRFSTLLVDSLLSALWLAMLTSLGFALWIVPLYTVFFQHGKIHSIDTIQNATAICAYSIGILFSSGSKVIVNAFYALNSTRVIVYNALIYLALNASLSYVLAPRFGMIGLGVSYGTCTAVDFALNLFFLKKFDKQNPYQHGGSHFLKKLALFGVMSYAIAWFGLESIIHLWSFVCLDSSQTLGFWNALGILVFGGSLYAVFCGWILIKFGPENLKQLIHKITRILKIN